MHVSSTGKHVIGYEPHRVLLCHLIVWISFWIASWTTGSANLVLITIKNFFIRWKRHDLRWSDPVIAKHRETTHFDSQTRLHDRQQTWLWYCTIPRDSGGQDKCSDIIHVIVLYKMPVRHARFWTIHWKVRIEAVAGSYRVFSINRGISKPCYYLQHNINTTIWQRKNEKTCNKNLRFIVQ